MMTYNNGAELPDKGYTLRDSSGVNLELDTDWTFTATVYGGGTQGIRFIKSTGFTGYDAAQTPNLVVTWATTGELSTLAPGEYMVKYVATYGPSGKTRQFSDTLFIRP